MRYRSPDEDSARWLRLPLRPGDIVISTRSKHGTTWAQAICALLVFGHEPLPEPLGRLSPWVDWLVEDEGAMARRLTAQRHRRILKTHTPLDGVVLDPRVTYVVVGRHPLDAAVSLHHHGRNLDRRRIAELAGDPALDPPPEAARPPLAEWIAAWIDQDADPRAELDSLPGTMWHLADAWARRDETNVVLVHYADLLADLDGGMRRLAGRLGVPVDERVWPRLVGAASLPAMRARASDLVPDPGGVIRDHAAFFREGRSGAGRDLLTDAQYRHYLRRAAQLAPPDLLTWLHR